MKHLILIGILLAGLATINGCNTVKGAANGFNKDMDSLTGHHNTTQATTYHTTNQSSSAT